MASAVQNVAVVIATLSLCSTPAITPWTNACDNWLLLELQTKSSSHQVADAQAGLGLHPDVVKLHQKHVHY
jgi:hypothetical protein